MIDEKKKMIIKWNSFRWNDDDISSKVWNSFLQFNLIGNFHVDIAEMNDRFC